MTRFANLKSLPERMRRRFTDGQRFLVLSVVAGFLCALLAVVIPRCTA
jgi:hypothetical protein